MKHVVNKRESINANIVKKRWQESSSGALIILIASAKLLVSRLESGVERIASMLRGTRRNTQGNIARNIRTVGSCMPMGYQSTTRGLSMSDFPTDRVKFVVLSDRCIPITTTGLTGLGGCFADIAIMGWDILGTNRRYSPQQSNISIGVDNLCLP
jgi:hypothetical protein